MSFYLINLDRIVARIYWNIDIKITYDTKVPKMSRYHETFSWSSGESEDPVRQTSFSVLDTPLDLERHLHCLLWSEFQQRFHCDPKSAP